VLVIADTASVWAAICSAIAAIFSAGSSLILLMIHFRNRADSVRPEIDLDGWVKLESPPGWCRINILKISNLGKGPALHIRAEAKFRERSYLGSVGR
jgi:hypothetical protein